MAEKEGGPLKAVRMDRRKGQMEGAEEKERRKYGKVMRHSY